MIFFYLSINLNFAQQELRLITPGSSKPDKVNFIGSDILFTWHKLANAANYTIMIAEKKNDSYKLIYTSSASELKNDTIFNPPSGLLKNSSKYRWNVKATLENGKVIFSDLFYFSFIQSKIPGNKIKNDDNKLDLYNSPKEPGIKINNPNLIIPINLSASYKFLKIYLAKKIKGKFKLIYKSPKISPGVKEHKIPEQYLSDNSLFRWNMKRVNKRGKFYFTKANYFHTDYSKSAAKEQVKSIIPVEIISPGSKQKNEFLIETETPKFQWKILDSSSSSSLIIFELENKKEKIIYSSDILPKKTNKFQIPKGILKTGKSYGWKIKSIDSIDSEVYSSALYFRYEEKKDVFIPPKIIPKEKEEIFLALKYAGLVNKTINAIYENGIVFLPVSEIFSNVEVDTKYDKKSQKLVAKNIFKQKTLVIDLANKKIEFGDSAYSLSSYKFHSTDFDLFFPTELFKSVTGIDTQVDLSNLIVTINSTESLPILNRKLREEKYGFVFVNRTSFDKKYIDYKRNQKLADFGILDYELSHNINKYSLPSTFYMLGAGGEFMGGDIQIQTRGNFRESKFGEKRTEAKWEYVFEKNSYISSFSAGTLDFEGLQHTTFDGISITNNPIEPRTEFGKIKITDSGNPNSTIELYLNNQLIDVVKSDATGNFSFDLPLNYGTSLVKLKFFGTFGEYQEKTKLYQIPILLLQENEFNYNLDIGKQNISRKDLRSFNIAYGITNWLTNRIGIEHLNLDNQKPVVYNTTSARLFDSYFANFSFSPTNFYSFNVDAMLPSQLAFDFEFSRYLCNGFFNQANLTGKISAHIFYPIQFTGSQINIQSFYSYSKTKTNDINDLTFGVSSYLSYFSPSINYHLVNVETNNLYFRNSTIDAGFNWSLNFLHYYLDFMRGSILTSRFYYNISRSKSESYSISFSTNLLESGRLQISHTENLINSYSLTQLNILFYFPFTQFSTSLSKETFSNSIIGSANYNFKSNEINLFNRQQIGRAGAIIRLYIDDNNNGVYDQKESLIKDGKVDISISETKYFSNGLIVAYDLNPYTAYQIKIREESIKNPMLVPRKKTFTFITEPNSFKEINIPFYIAGEVGGKVFRKVNKNIIPLAGLKIHITNIMTGESNTVTTFSDGSFYYFGLLPGKYKVIPDKEQLSSINVKLSKDDYEFEITGDVNAKENIINIYIDN